MLELNVTAFTREDECPSFLVPATIPEVSHELSG
jgi:hypothetical protein